MRRSERAQRVSHASGVGRDARACPSTIARDALSPVEGRARPPTLFELRRGLAVALAKADAGRGDRRGDAPRVTR
jgi:hypothetical protein